MPCTNTSLVLINMQYMFCCSRQLHDANELKYSRSAVSSSVDCGSRLQLLLWGLRKMFTQCASVTSICVLRVCVLRYFACGRPSEIVTVLMVTSLWRSASHYQPMVCCLVPVIQVGSGAGPHLGGCKGPRLPTSRGPLTR